MWKAGLCIARRHFAANTDILCFSLKLATPGLVIGYAMMIVRAHSTRDSRQCSNSLLSIGAISISSRLALRPRISSKGLIISRFNARLILPPQELDEFTTLKSEVRCMLPLPPSITRTTLRRGTLSIGGTMRIAWTAALAVVGLLGCGEITGSDSDQNPRSLVDEPHLAAHSGTTGWAF